MLLLGDLLLSPRLGVAVLCAAAVSESLVFLLCELLQSPRPGVTFLCAAAQESLFFCCVRYCSLQCLVLLSCVQLQSP